MPGPAQLRTLLAFALRCGVGASASAVMQRPSAALKLAALWEPGGLLTDLGDHDAAAGHLQSRY